MPQHTGTILLASLTEEEGEKPGQQEHLGSIESNQAQPGYKEKPETQGEPCSDQAVIPIRSEEFRLQH